MWEKLARAALRARGVFVFFVGATPFSGTVAWGTDGRQTMRGAVDVCDLETICVRTCCTEFSEISDRRCSTVFLKRNGLT